MSKAERQNIFEAYDGTGELWADGQHICNCHYAIGHTNYRHAAQFGGELSFRGAQGYRLHLNKDQRENIILVTPDGRYRVGWIHRIHHTEIVSEKRILRYDRNTGAMMPILERTVEAVEIKVEFYQATPADAPPPVAEGADGEMSLASRLEWQGGERLMPV